MTSKTAPHALEPDTQQLALDAARAAGQSDEFLDRASTAIYLPLDVADALLEARGWRIDRRAERDGGEAYRFWAPDGRFCWHRDEALKLALVAEAFDMDPELTDAI